MLIRTPRLPRSRRRQSVRRSAIATVPAAQQTLETLEDRLLLTGETVGLLQYDMAQAFEGYNLLHPSTSRTTYLIDMEGRVVNEWTSNYTTTSNYLLEDGSLVRHAALPNTPQTMNAGGATGRIERFDWDGNLIWYYELNEPKGVDGNMRLHHDIHIMPNGNILAIAWEYLSDETAIAMGRDPAVFDDPSEGVWPEAIVEIEPDLDSGVGGEIVWSWHAKDHLIQDFDPTKENFGVVEDHPELIDFNYVVTGDGATTKLSDWNHANGLHYDAQLDQIAISLRSQSEFWVIDHSTTTEEAASHSGGNSGQGGDLLYRWGNEAAYGAGIRDDQQLFFQHDIQFIEDGLDGAGNFLVFNNGWNRPDGMSYSSADEIVPPRVNEQFHLAQLMDGSMGDVVSFASHTVPASWQPIAGDWDGDGTDSTGGFDPATGTFYFNNSNAEGFDDVSGWASPLSGAGLLAVVGDWDGDGIDTPGVYDPATATFTLFNSTSGSGAISLTLDNAGAGPLVPLAGDWNGDSFDSVGLYDVTGTEFRYTDIVVVTDVDAWNSLNRGDIDAAWQPVVGDWDGNGADSIGWYDPSMTTLHYGDDLGNASEVLASSTATDALDSWRPIVGDWNDNSSSTLGLYAPDYGQYELGMDGTYGPADLEWTYEEGPSGTFYSSIVSSVQRLPNGNTLIGEGGHGRAFEVTPAGEIVWEYVNPVDFGNPLHQGDSPGFLPGAAMQGVTSNIIFRMNRYAPDFAGFDGRDLTPGDVIERTDPNVVVAVDMAGNLTITDIIAGGSANTITVTFDSMANELVVTSSLHDLGDGINPSTNEIRVPRASVTTGRILADLGARNDVFDASAIGFPVNVLGGDGNDAITGGMADDTIDGGAGDDMLAGLGGDDLLVGGDDNDSIRGSGGRDLIYGGPGNDLLRGQGGHDDIRGGAGVDRIEGGSGTTAVDDEVGGNVIIDADGYHSDRGDFAEVVPRRYGLTGTSQADLFDASASPIGVAVDGGGGDDTLIGSNFDDVLSGNGGHDAIRGGAGNDRLIGNTGNDTLLGGDGNDALIGGSNDDVLLGEAGTDRVRGNGGFDTLTGAGNGTMLEGDLVIADAMDTVDDAFMFDFDALLI